MKGQKLTLATLLVIVIGVIAVALLTIGIWFGYQSVAAKYGWHPPSGPNFGNLALPPYTIEVSGVDEITFDDCLNLVESGVIDKGKFNTTDDYCKYYCPFRCYLINTTLYSYLYNKAQDVTINLYVNASSDGITQKVFIDSRQAHLDPWNGNMVNGKSSTTTKVYFVVPIYPNDCQLNGFLFNTTNGDYEVETFQEQQGSCVLCGCMPGQNCINLPCCPYLANFAESTIEMLDEVVCNTSNNHCTTCQTLCESAGFKHGECINNETSFSNFSKGRCAPTSETDYPDESKWDNCICYDFPECEGTCNESCSEGEIGYYTKDCSSQGKFCCISYGGGGGGGGVECDPTAKPKCDTETMPCCINGNWQCVTYCPT